MSADPDEVLPTYAVLADWHRARADRCRRSAEGWAAALARECTDRHREQYAGLRAQQLRDERQHRRFAALAGHAAERLPALTFTPDGRLTHVGPQTPEPRL